MLQINWHQYAVAARFDAATFAIYAVGCLQIPLVDLIVTSTANVMMVEMAERRSADLAAARWLWHDTIVAAWLHDLPAGRVPVVMARDIIVAALHQRLRRQRADLHAVVADHAAVGAGGR